MNFYHGASSVLDKLDARRGSIKGIIGLLPESSRSRTAALVIETLKYKAVLLDIMENSSLLREERKHLSSRNLALVLVHDLLFSKGGIQASDGPIKQAILRHKTRLQAELVKLKVKRRVRTNRELALQDDTGAALLPRYVRINTIKWTMEEAIEYLTQNGFSRSGSPFDSSISFAIDEHVPNLLYFHPSVTFHKNAAYLGGKLILQDKASCFPALVLAPEDCEGVVALDATAAPGNKTSHLSALMENKGKILALERDRRRFKTLESTLARAGCRNVEAANLDFLSIDPQTPRYARVTHMLLDPSCSGSGMVNRMDYLVNSEGDFEGSQPERLGRLAMFQLTMIKHAMKFPRVTKIVYSTCSIHAIENEHVVAQALDTEEARIGGFVLAPRAQVIPTWCRRGLSEEMGDHLKSADSLIRCIPKEDFTNGFFVSCFVRRRFPHNECPEARGPSKRKRAGGHEEPRELAGMIRDDNQITDKKRKRKRKRHQ